MPIAGNLTAKQERLVEVVVLGAESISDAARKAGMSRENASRSLSRSVTVQREVARRSAAQADSARGLLRASARNVAKAVARDEEGEYSLRTWGTAAVVLEKLGDTEEGTAPEARHVLAAERMYLRGLKAGMRIGCAPPDVLMHAMSKYDARDAEITDILSEAK